jgi:hypothetical protein
MVDVDSAGIRRINRMCYQIWRQGVPVQFYSNTQKQHPHLQGTPEKSIYKVF